MIEQEVIQHVKDVARIEEVVGDYVTLHRRGANLVGLCPFHQEKTPSFNVNPARNICKCFGCGKGGDPVHFVMAVEGCNFIEAVKKLGDKYHIEVKERVYNREDQQKQDLRESLFAINEFAADWFQKQMWQTDEGRAVAQSYFMQKRQLREDVVRKFRLGYSPEAWDAFTQAALQAGFKEELLLKTGLCKKTEQGKLYDFFRGRVIYPARTQSGKIVAFGGRIMTENKKVGKYFNSPESEIYEKKRELYGIFEARQEIVNKKFTYLVEGYMDVISMHQAGVENVVASSGTSLTEEQVKLIRRYTENVTVCYDGDSAGIHAAIRSINMLLSEGLNIKLLLLPDGHDPDSFSHQMSAEDFQTYISEHRTDFIQYMASQYAAESQNDPVLRSELINEVLQSISLIPDMVTQQVYIQDCSRLLGMASSVLEQKLGEIKAKNRQEQEREQQREFYRQHASTSQSSATSSAYSQRPVGGQGYSPSRFQQPAYLIPKVHPVTYDTLIAKQMSGVVAMMVRYGTHEFHDESTGTTITAGEFILQELDADGIQASNPVLQQMIDEYREHMHEESFQPDVYFSSHPDSDVAQMAQRLLGIKYKLSRIFSRQTVSENVVQDVHVQTDDERLDDLIPKLLFELKLNIVRREERMIQNQMEQQADIDDASIMELCARLNQLKQAERLLARALDRPVS